MQKNVLVVEDDVLTARGFAYSLGAVPTLSLVAVVHTAGEAIRFLENNTVDVCLVDLGLPDASGLSVVRFAAGLPTPVHTLVVTVFGDETNVLAAIGAGASGYLLKDALTVSVAHEVESLLQGGSPLSPSVARLLLERLRVPLPVTAALPTSVMEKVVLSARETEVLSLIARGCTYKEVSSALAISNVTVASHLKNTYQKLAVHSKNEAVYEASKMGLIQM
nr:response regulator transcription factor [uncultured Albidiferax sp.]